MARSTGSECTSSSAVAACRCGFLLVAARFGVASADRALPQRFHVGKQVLAGLLAQHLAQQHAERTHIAPQRSLFQFARLRLQLRQALRPALEDSTIRPSCFDYARPEIRTVSSTTNDGIVPNDSSRRARLILGGAWIQSISESRLRRPSPVACPRPVSRQSDPPRT